MKRKRQLVAAGLSYQLLGPKSGTLFVLLHGWLQGWRFVDQCRMHEHVQVAYPRASWWKWNNWSRRNAEQIAAFSVEAARACGASIVVLGGLSDGTSPIHEAATILLQRERPILLQRERPRLRAIVHYSGLWPKRHHAACRGLFLAGENDWLPTVRITDEAAQAYGEAFLRVPGGHEWYADANPQIIAAVPEST